MRTTTITTWFLGCCIVLLLAAAATTAALSFSWSTLLPRMPEYYFRVTSLPIWWFWTTGQIQVPSFVSLFNDNIFPVDVHAISFDLYYPTWDAIDENNNKKDDDRNTKDDATAATASSPSLIHLGHVIDKQQHQQKVLLLQQKNATPCYYHHGGMLRCTDVDEDDEDDENDHDDRLLLTSSSSSSSTSVAAAVEAQRNTTTTTTTTTTNTAAPPDILWSVPARASFATTDDIFVSPSTITSWSTVLYHGVAQIAWNALVHGKSTVYIPSTGVLYVHAKALNQKVPLTIGIVCDNALSLWTMELRGLHCVMHSIDLGWWPLEAHVSQLRNMALYEWMPMNATKSSTTNTIKASIVQRKRRKQPLRKPHVSVATTEL